MLQIKKVGALQKAFIVPAQRLAPGLIPLIASAIFRAGGVLSEVDTVVRVTLKSLVGLDILPILPEEASELREKAGRVQAIIGAA